MDVPPLPPWGRAREGLSLLLLLICFSSPTLIIIIPVPNTLYSLLVLFPSWFSSHQTIRLFCFHFSVLYHDGYQGGLWGGIPGASRGTRYHVFSTQLSCLPSPLLVLFFLPFLVCLFPSSEDWWMPVSCKYRALARVSLSLSLRYPCCLTVDPIGVREDTDGNDGYQCGCRGI